MENQSNKIEIGKWKLVLPAHSRYPTGNSPRYRQRMASQIGAPSPVSSFDFPVSNFVFRFSIFQFLSSSFHFPLRGTGCRQGSARRSRHQIWRGNQLIDQAQRQGLAGRNTFRGQQELRRRRPADQASQALSPSPTGDEAEGSSGVAKRSIVGRDASVARQSQIQSPSQTIPPDGRNDGKREVRNVVEEHLSRPCKSEGAYPFNRCHLLQGGAGCERAGVCGNHHALEKAGQPDFIQEIA
jgi:hypothetical protein